MSTDPYGSDVTLSPSGDLIVAPSGDLASLDGPLNAAQALLSRLRTRPGELPLHPEYGSNVLALIGTRQLDEGLAAATVTNELRAIIDADRRYAAATAQAGRGAPDSGTETLVITLTLAGGEEVSFDAMADVRLDEIDVSAAPTLDALSADLDPALVGIESVVDTADELPELDDLIANADATDVAN